MPLNSLASSATRATTVVLFINATTLPHDTSQVSNVRGRVAFRVIIFKRFPGQMQNTKIKTLPGARKAALPKIILPQLATLVKEPPPGDQWLHELKFDGYRMLCRIDRGKVRFWSRNGKEWTKFLNVVEAVKSLPVKSAILDGEIVVVDAQGQSSFQKLQRAMGKSVTSGFVFEVFDLIYLDGFNLTKTPLRQCGQLGLNQRRNFSLRARPVACCTFSNATSGGCQPQV